MQLLLRPQPRHSLPLVIMVIVADLLATGLAVGLVTVHNVGAATLMAAAALATGGTTWAYFKLASLRIEGGELIKTNALGQTLRCAVEDVARIETRYAPQPTLRFIRRDGSLAFRINARLWRSDQIAELRAALPLCKT